MTLLLTMALVAIQPAPMTARQVYETAKTAGFERNMALVMTAIAMRESNLTPGSVYITDKEHSIGLWQINTKDAHVWKRVANLVRNNPSKLKNPLLCAKAAYMIWAGNPGNLEIAWAINRDPYRKWFYDCLAAVKLQAHFERWN